METFPEILAPAGNEESVLAAVNTGADAVYLGLDRFSARQKAANFTPETLPGVVRFCHKNNVKVYLALNTLVFDDEIPALESTVLSGKNSGVDAFIVQDLAAVKLAKRLAPEIPLHASTQMTVMSDSGIRTARELGFRRVVIAREMPLESIKAAAKTALSSGIELEMFVHGALCTSLSGQCMMSAFFSGGEEIRSANRGFCGGPCRLNFTVRGNGDNCDSCDSCDNSDNGKYALSLKDLCLLPHLRELSAAENSGGIASFKIEGRLKRPEYVAAAVTAVYSELRGLPFDADILRNVFSRSGFTDGYLTGNHSEMNGIRTKENVVSTEKSLKQLRALYTGRVFPRYVIDFEIVITSEEFTVRGTITESDISAAASSLPPENAVSRETSKDEVRAQIGKLGGTIFRCGEVKLTLEPGLAVPVKTLNALRREIAQKLEAELENS